MRIRLFLPLAVAIVALGACTRAKKKSYPPIAFPPGFLWGTAPAAPAPGTAGWPSKTTQTEFEKWAGDMAQEYGGDVDDWIIFNEPMVAAVAAFQQAFPPDLGGDLDKTTAMVAGMIQAHARAYE